MSNKTWFCENQETAKNYIKICETAASDEYYFNNFKSISDYQTILEHVSAQQGYVYLNQINSLMPKLQINSDILSFAASQNDKIGNPKLIDTNLGKISPTSLRYIYFALIMNNFFDLSNCKNLLDIGAGYGGQSLILNKIYKLQNIFLNDLPEANKLQAKYLNNFNIHPNTSSNISDYYDKKFDLCVSTFALSEFTKHHRKEIIGNILPNCKNVFLICNFINDEIFDDFEMNELLNTSHNFLYYKELHENHCCSVFLIKNNEAF